MANLSFASPPSSDNDCGMFTQSYSDPCNDLFDQFLDLDSLDSEGSIFPVPPSSTLLAKRRTVSGTVGPLRDEHVGCEKVSLEPRYKESTASHPEESTSDYPNQDTSVRAAISDSELLNLEGLHIPSPAIPPHTPSLKSSPTYPLTPSTTGKRHRILDVHGSRTSRKTSSHQRHSSLHHTKLKPEPDIQRSPIRKVTSPAKMMRAQQYSDQTLHEWSQRLAEEAKGFHFEFQNPANQPLSPPLSARVSDASQDGQAGGARVSGVQAGFAWDRPVPQYGEQPHSQPGMHTPMQTPEENSFAFHRHASIDLGVNATHINQAGNWAQQHPTPLNSEYGFSASANTSDYTDDTDAPLWWGNAGTGPAGQSGPGPFQRSAQQAKTQTLALQLQNELAFNASELAMSPSGLMIQNMPPSPNGQSYVVVGDGSGNDVSPHLHPQSCYPQERHLSISSNGMSISGTRSPQHGYSASHSLPLSSNPHEHGPFGPLVIRKSRPTGLIHRDSYDNCTDDEADGSPSPTSGTPRTMSITSINPVSGLPHSKAHSRRVASRRGTSAHSIRSTSAAGRRSSKSGSISAGSGMTGHSSGSGMGMPKGGGGGIDFVNFTPHDSMKILTGVAPSGSSKTKARREKEAADKRRRLSLAAVRAVRAAGGSIEGLLLEEDVGLEGSDTGL